VAVGSQEALVILWFNCVDSANSHATRAASAGAACNQQLVAEGREPKRNTDVAQQPTEGTPASQALVQSLLDRWPAEKDWLPKLQDIFSQTERMITANYLLGSVGSPRYA
jgi:hypothetical protein